MGTLVDFLLLIAVLTIIGILVFSVNQDARDNWITNTAGCNSTDTYACGAGYNATIDVDQGGSKVSSNLTLLGTAIVFGVILFIILRILPKGANKVSF